MLTLKIINQYDDNLPAEFGEFFEAGGAVAALTDGEKTVGMAQVVFEGGAVLRRLKILPSYDYADCRRFFVRALVLALKEGVEYIYSEFDDAMLGEIGFCKTEGGMSCRSADIVFKKMCGGK
ncbi:MAG: hypothetical protein LBQ40_00910 [Clostridiales bacterium]|jgi:hypothetical protein|nr:hypothetical protein [Clostridiales bacterium]